MATATEDRQDAAEWQGSQALAHELAEIIRPPAITSLSEWVGENVRIPATMGAIGGRFDFDRFPFWRGVLDACDDWRTEHVTIKAGAQVGKTTLLQALIVSRPFVQPSPGMLAGPDQDYIREMRDKIYSMAMASPAIAELVPEERLWNDRFMRFGGSLCYLAWSGSVQRLSGRPCQFVLKSEVDRWRQSPREGNTARIVKARTQAFFRWLEVDEGTPTDENSPISASYDESDRRQFLCPCPICGHFQSLRFFVHREGKYAGRGGFVGYMTDEGKPKPEESILRETHYSCEAKGCEIDDIAKSAMVKLGRHVPDGQRITRGGKLVGKPKRSPRHAGFQIPLFLGDTRALGRIALQWIEDSTSDDSRQVFFNTVLGLKYSRRRRKMPKWRELARRLEAGHTRGTAPPTAAFVTVGVDKQRDRIYWVARAWGEATSSWLVDFGFLRVRLGKAGQTLFLSDLDQLDKRISGREIRLTSPNANGLEGLRPLATGLDIGFRPLDLAWWIHRQNNPRLKATRGDPSLRADPYRIGTPDNKRHGRPYPPEFEVVRINTNFWKSDLLDRWNGQIDQPGAWLLCADAINSCEAHVRQMVSESPEMIGGRRVFKHHNQRLPNHYLDAEVIARTMAEICVGGDWSDVFERQAADIRRDEIAQTAARTARKPGKAPAGMAGRQPQGAPPRDD